MSVLAPDMCVQQRKRSFNPHVQFGWPEPKCQGHSRQPNGTCTCVQNCGQQHLSWGSVTTVTCEVICRQVHARLSTHGVAEEAQL